MKTQIIILAAGHGTRMKSNKAKVLQEIKGKPIIKYLLDSVGESGVCSKPTIVISQKSDQVRNALGNKYTYIFQRDQLGTGHAIASTKEYLRNGTDHVLVLYGDHPFLTGQTIKRLNETHIKEKNIFTLITIKTPDFDDWRKDLLAFGRIIREPNGNILKIVEAKDATEEEKKVKELNPGYFCFQTNWLWNNIDKLTNDNAQKEYYLTDLVEIAMSQKQKVSSFTISNVIEGVGINTPEQLALAENLLS